MSSSEGDPEKSRSPAAAYLKKYGRTVIENGYEIVPIKPGTKRSPFKAWEATRADLGKLDRWLEQGRGDHGLGVLARKTPLVDIDCHDPVIVKKMIAYTIDLLGDTIQRIGLAPKSGLVYRTSTPFPKVNSATYADKDGRVGVNGKPITHKLEVLGDGQQFVAFAIHPDTKNPYRWTDKKAIHNTAWADLPEITREDAKRIAAYFEDLMDEAGYIKKSKARLDAKGGSGIHDDDDEFITDSQKVDLSTSDLSLKLALVPGADDYDTWRDIGMALYHQYDGDEDGLLLWHEWSSQAPNYDMDVLDEKWPTFNIEGKGRAPVTCRLILKLAIEEEKRVAGEQAEETREEIKSAKTVEALRDAAELVKRIPFEPIIREGIVDLVRKRYKEICGNSLSLPMARQLVRYENPENKRSPKWLLGFVYIERDKVFYHTENRMELDAEAFNAKHNRFMMTQKDRLEGRSSPEHTAAQAALNLWEIETVYRRMYMPHEDQFFTYNGQRFVNFYTEVGVPDVPEKLNNDEKAAIECVKGHFKHLFVQETAGIMLLDWMAYIVQTRCRVKWMPLIQGTEGDGKTFFAELLKAVLGDGNVRIEPGEAVQERYNHFLEGSLIVFFEEIRLHGKHRYEVLNRVKPWITNGTITIRAMHRGSYEITNTTSLIAASNYKDAIPAGENDTRYYPLFSRWQTKQSIDAFKAKNPSYYDKLYASLKQSGALRKWLLQHPVSTDFCPWGRAPESPYRSEMLALNETDLTRAFRETLNECGRSDFCETLLDSALIDQLLEDKNVCAPRDRARNMFLSEQGFSQFPKKITVSGQSRNYWTKHPEQFFNGGHVYRNAVVNWLDPDRI